MLTPTSSRGPYRADVGDAVAPDEWDAFVERAVGGHHLQTSLWGEVKASTGWTPVRLAIRHGSSIVGGVQLVSRAVGIFGRVAFGARGPLLETDDPLALQALLSSIDHYARVNRIRYVKLQPPAGREDIVGSLRHAGWSHSGLEAAPTATVRLDLRKSEDELLANMRKTRRNEVRNATARGISIRRGTGDDDVQIFYMLLDHVARRRGFPLYPRRYFETMFRVFSERGKANLLIAFVDGEPVAADLVLAYGDTAVTKAGASRSALGARPSVALHWSGICWAKEHGYRWYDFEGIPKRYAEELKATGSLPSEASQGVSGFKLSFGGEVELFPEALDRSPNAVLRPAVKLLAPRMDRAGALAQRVLGRTPTTSG